MSATDTDPETATTTGPSPAGGPLRVGMFGGGTVGGGVYEICEQVRGGKTLSCRGLRFVLLCVSDGGSRRVVGAGEDLVAIFRQ